MSAMEMERKIGRPSLCYTINQVANFYAVSLSTAYRWAEMGEIPTVRRGGVLRIPKNRMDVILREDGILDAA